MQPKSHAILTPAPRRPGRLLPALLFLVLAGLLWSWAQAQAKPLSAAPSEPASFVLEAATVAPGAGLKALPLQDAAADLVLNEIADQDVLHRWHVLIALTQALLVPAPQPALQEAERQPLLRPPSRLG